MPASFVVDVRTWLVPMFLNSAVANCMTAPCGSVTTPVTVPRLVCPKAGALKTSSMVADSRRARVFELIRFISLPNEPDVISFEYGFDRLTTAYLWLFPFNNRRLHVNKRRLHRNCERSRKFVPVWFLPGIQNYDHCTDCSYSSDHILLLR